MPTGRARNVSLPIQDWANEMEQALERFFGNPLSVLQPSREGGNFTACLDVAETEKEYHVHVDLPGVKPEEVKLEIVDDRLTISGKREAETKTEGKNFHRIERSTGEFFRTVMLPQSIDQENISAEFSNGVLNIRLPKSIKNQPKKIEIRSANGQS